MDHGHSRNTAAEERLVEDLVRAIGDAKLLTEELSGVAMLTEGTAATADLAERKRAALELAAETARTASARAARIMDDLSETIRKHGGTSEDLDRGWNPDQGRDDIPLKRRGLWQSWPEVRENGEIVG